MKSPLVITDSSVLIGLERVDRLDLLPALFPGVIAPPTVVREFGWTPEWLRVEAARSQTVVKVLRVQLLDAGEAEAIALTREHPGAILLLDERRGRRFALQIGLRMLGTAGLLLEAKQAGLTPAVRPLLEELAATGFRLSDAIHQYVLKLAGEA